MNKNNSQIKKCKTCGSDATCLCFQCQEYFCEECYKYVHDKQINKTHKKENIDFYVPIDFKCPDHPNNAMNLFCVDEKGNSNI